MAHINRCWLIRMIVLVLWLAPHDAATQPIQGDQWNSIGPTPILGGQTFPPSPVTGRVADVAVDPSNPDHWLIGAAQGGVWETSEAGATWIPRTDNEASLAMGAIAFAPSNPNIIYAGTGEAVFSADAYGGGGLLKSTDGGATWVLISSVFTRETFSDIKVDPADPNILLSAIADGGCFGRFAFCLSFGLERRGIFKSIDGGVNWSQKLRGTGTDLEVDPSNFNNQYAGIGQIFGSPSENGIYRSLDGGETWTLVNGPWSAMSGGVGRVELAIAPSNPNVLYVSIQDAFNGIGNDGQLLGLFRTSNAWAPTPTWVRITSAPDFCQSQCWYDHEIIVDPTNPDTLYAGGVSLFRFDGSTWMNVSDGLHVDQHSMAWVGNRLIVGNDGGVWSTTNGGNSWTNHNTNLSITQFYEGSIHPTNAGFVLGGSQDNGTEVRTGGNAWTLIFGGDGADNAISSTNPDTNWAISFQNMNIRRTTNGGASFVVADSGIDKSGAPFIARFEKCPANDNVFIAGTDNLWRTNNFFSAPSPSWLSNSPEMGTSITALAFAPSDPACNTYAFGTDLGQLRLTVNGGSTWIDIDPGNTVPDFRLVTDLAFNPTDANVLYVTLGGFDEFSTRPGHVFKSPNILSASPTWSNVSPPVNVPHNTIVLDSFDPNIVYVGTDQAVWKTNDAGITWTHMGPEAGIPNVAVFELQINDTTGRLAAFTHGRGAFALVTSNVVNNLVSFDPIPSTFNTTSDAGGCPLGFMGKFNFDARLTDQSGSPPLSDLVARVTTLTNGNLLQNADGGPGGAGATLTIPKLGSYSDGVLSQGEFVDVPFSICLNNTEPFSFFVDVSGLRAGNTSNMLVLK